MDGAYTYDSNELATSDAHTCDGYGQFDQARHTGPANTQLHGVGFAQPVGESSQSQVTTETRFNPSHLEYLSPNAQVILPIASTRKYPHEHFHSKLRPPTLYHHHTHPSQHHTSTLPPLHHHSNISGGEGGGTSQFQGGTMKAPLHTLPTIVHGRSKTYAGRNNRMGYESLSLSLSLSLALPLAPTLSLSLCLCLSLSLSSDYMFPRPPQLTGASGGKRMDSAQQKIRLAEKEQKLYETQEFIQV